MIDSVRNNQFFIHTKDAVMISKDGYFQWVNPAMIEILDYPLEEIITKPILDFIHPDDKPGVAALIAEKNATASGYETRYRAKNGEWKWFSWSFTRNPANGYGISVGRHITEEKKRTSEREENRLRTISDSRLDAVHRLASNMSHEINNPLTVIYGQACHLRRLSEKNQISADEVFNIARSLEAMSLRIMDIVGNLNSFTKSTSSESFVGWPLQIMLEDTIKLCRAKIESDGINLIIEKISPEAAIFCRPGQISQALFNLIQNSADAAAVSAEKKWIRIQVEQKNNFFEIQVRDSGRGIEQANIAKLFAPFFTTKPVGKSLGLGLSRAQTICHEHQGELMFVGNSPTTFSIRLPVYQIPGQA